MKMPILSLRGQQSNLPISGKRRRPSFIADFPSSHQRKASPKGVKFSPEEPSIRFYDRPDESELSDLFYSDEDIVAMANDRRLAVRDIRMAFAMMKTGDLTVDDDAFLCSITGVENFLTPSLCQKSKICKGERRLAVMNEQFRQRMCGEDDPERLAKIAQTYSWWAVKRAEHIGRCHAN
ncbi:hypothetical protein ACHAXT_000122 [Thalassiosira profunda]